MKHFFLVDSKNIELKEGNSTLGRASDNLFFINEQSISSKHLLISNFLDYVEITDLNSSNGTLVNNSRLVPLVPKRLNSGDNLILGRLPVTYKTDGKEEKSSIIKNNPYSELKNAQKFKDVTIMAKFDPKDFNTILQEAKDTAETQKTSKRLSFLYSFGQKIGTIMSLNELSKYIVKEIFTIFPEATRALLFIINDGKYEPIIFMKDGIELPISEAKYSKTIVELAMEEKHGFIASDLANNQEIDTSKSILALNLQCTMIAPFVVDNEIFGLFQVDSTRKINAFNQEDLTLLSGISNQIAINIKNKLLVAEMNKQEKVKNSLERYLGPKMVNHLIDNKINLDQKGEERFVSVLFSDIRGFTSLSEKLEPKQIIEILTIYFSKMTEVIFKYDGFIDKFIGDAVFCIFGIPLSQDNHPDLAVKTALDMRKELEELNKQFRRDFNLELRIGIGVNTGKVVYGNIASMDRPEVTILGDTVNTAERLCSSAKKGEIFISYECLKNLKDTYKIQDEGLFTLKGKEEQVNIYSVS